MTENSTVGTPVSWARLAAAIIDGIVLFVAFWILSFVVEMLTGMSMMSPIDPETFMIDYTALGMSQVISLVLYTAYFAVQESSAAQATVGKRVMGIKVVGKSGGQISLMHAIGRYLAKIVSTLILMIGFLMILFTKNKQGLHDMIAGTYVVKN